MGTSIRSQLTVRRNSPTDPVIAWLPAIDQHLS
jgi:hypothetical protein